MRIDCLFQIQNVFIFLFFITILGIVMNPSNIIIILILLEVMYLHLIIYMTMLSISTSLASPLLLTIYIISLAAVESALGLSLVIIFYKLKGSITLSYSSLLKG